MQHETRAMPVALRVARKEMALFFASPIAWLFLASFAAITLFIFFWGEAFFARNIVDVRPLFEWMPVLLILLCSTLTMRMWSEERRAGTLEHVLTQPAPLWCFVLGKFLGCLALLFAALLVTLPLPITVAALGELDWGPVLAGYVATFLLGAAYLAVGLFVSAQTQNQIVSLIASVALCGLFYVIGSPLITDFLGQRGGELFRSLGTGSRFDAITRGVIDIGDLYYYLSLIAVFLALNVFTLKRERWPQLERSSRHRRWQILTGLLVLNALAANLWIGQLNTLRLDTTRGQQYTLSDATRNYLGQLREPLTLRGYFSAKTHPLLSPLVPQVRDLLQEYEVAGDGRVRVEFVDPMAHPEIEEEANQQYGIEPVPFQVADRYQSSIVSSYFNVLVQYGNEFDVLGFQELIDVKSTGASDIDVQLRNPEYDLTKSIRKVLQDFQSAGNVFDTVKQDVSFVAYLSPSEQLPAELQTFRATMETVANEFAQQSNGKLQVSVGDPNADGGEVAAQLARDFGFRPLRTDLFSNDQFWFHLILRGGDQIVQLPLDDLSEASFRTNLEAGLKRFASGFTKRIALVTPPVAPMGQQQMQPGGAQFNRMQEFLRAELDIASEDLSDGRVSSDADLLMLASPSNLDDQALFAVDQFLMQGGTVIVATSPHTASLSRDRIDLTPHTSGLGEWLAHHGFTIAESLVMDPQNAAFPVPVTRNVGGMQLQELRMLDYPYFIDVRSDGLNTDSPIAADLGQVTLAWASPISVDAERQQERDTQPLIESSVRSWLTTSTDVMPRMEQNNVSSWQPEGDAQSQILAVSSRGRFDSYFAGKTSPLVTDTSAVASDAADATASNADPAASNDAIADEGTADVADPQEELLGSLDTVIERSPESARLILIASNDFLRDQVTQMTGAAQGNAYLAPFQLIANSIDHSLDDTGLLSIRGRGQFNRTLPPMDRGSQRVWEYLNYGLAAVAIGLIAVFYRMRKRRREQEQLAWMTS